MVVELIVELVHVETQRNLSDDIQVGHNPHYSLPCDRTRSEHTGMSFYFSLKCEFCVE